MVAGDRRADEQERYVESVLRIVEVIPPGRVSTYGIIADAVGRGGPRQVGRVMALYGGGVPWWRVVRADGSLPLCHQRSALPHYREEETPLRGDLTDIEHAKVVMRSAVWYPDSSD